MANFSATPVGQPLCCSSTDACAAAWKTVNDEVAKVDAMPDIRARNKAISASYANLHMASPDLKWAGTAAFAYKQVGCGMDTAHTYLDDYPGGIAQAAQDMAANGGSIDPVSATMYDARQTLGASNLAVYDELKYAVTQVLPAEQGHDEQPANHGLYQEQAGDTRGPVHHQGASTDDGRPWH